MSVIRFLKRKVLKPLARGLLIMPFYLVYEKKYLKSKWFNIDYFFIYGFKWLKTCFFQQKILGINKNIRFPCNRFVDIASSEKINFDIDDIQNFTCGFGNYYQNFSGNITLGKGTYIAHNVAIITANHDFYNLDKHYPPKDVIIGNDCWIGINSSILPGTVLGNHTIVGAGSVVTKSFPDGNCIIAGNPAKVIKLL